MHAQVFYFVEKDVTEKIGILREYQKDLGANFPDLNMIVAVRVDVGRDP